MTPAKLAAGLLWQVGRSWNVKQSDAAAVAALVSRHEQNEDTRFWQIGRLTRQDWQMAKG